MENKAFQIHTNDNVAVAVEPRKKGETALGITLLEDIAAGHKFALKDIFENENVIKYAFPIGHATKAIKAGEWVHTQNLKTNLGDILNYTYTPHLQEATESPFEGKVFSGYRRANGKVGIRNEIWIIPTVGCVNGTAMALEKEATKRFGHSIPDGIHAFIHPYGCSQMGDDHENTQKLLAAMVRHPNAGGVLVLGLGCENNNIPAFKKVLGDADENRVKFLSTQDVEDEMEAGLALLEKLAEALANDKRESLPVSELVIGLKCGGSDGFSGITANPLLGALSDGLISAGGTSILTEVPEMFGAETLLMNRCQDEKTFSMAVDLINDFKRYFQRYNQTIYENPSPGNKAGGITTLEEKSLGCTQKGGTSTVKDVLSYAEPVKQKGLNLLTGPGNDICAVTALMASGCHMVFFTTGRGTPLGAPIPTVKVATNSRLANRKSSWIDFNAGTLLEGEAMETLRDRLIDKALEIADGEKTLNERNNYREIAIFKDGVTL
jgi:Altronate dehydratase